MESKSQIHRRIRIERISASNRLVRRDPIYTLTNAQSKAVLTFEDTWDIAVQESAAGDMFFASEEDWADKLGAAQRQQDDALESLEECRKNMDSACREFSTAGLSMRRRGSMWRKRVGDTPN